MRTTVHRTILVDVHSSKCRAKRSNRIRVSVGSSLKAAKMQEGLKKSKTCKKEAEHLKKKSYSLELAWII